MPRSRQWWSGFGGALLVILFSASTALAQEISLEKRPWTASVIRPSGQPIIPLFEGYYPNGDGSSTLCFGYFSLNTEERIDVPIGPENVLSPAGFDGAQPTYFEPVPGEPYRYRRRWCAFTVRVPQDFGSSDQVVWTLRTAGQTLTAPGHLDPAYLLDEIESDGRGDVAPILHFEGGIGEAQGRNGATTSRLTARVGEPIRLAFHIAHPEDEVWVGWAKHAGPGEVTFGAAEFEVTQPSMVAETTATFSTPGDYLLRVQSIDSIAAFEFHCCWTNAYIPVTVNP